MNPAAQRRRAATYGTRSPNATRSSTRIGITARACIPHRKSYRFERLRTRTERCFSIALSLSTYSGRRSGPSSFLAGKFTREFLKKEGNSLAWEWTYKEYRKGVGGTESEWNFKSAEDLKDIMEQARSRHPDGILWVGSPGDAR